MELECSEQKQQRKQTSFLHNATEWVTHKINSYDTFAGINLAQGSYQHVVKRLTCQNINTSGKVGDKRERFTLWQKMLGTTFEFSTLSACSGSSVCPGHQKLPPHPTQATLSSVAQDQSSCIPHVPQMEKVTPTQLLTMADSCESQSWRPNL